LLHARLGVQLVLQTVDEEWLRESYPGLAVAGEILGGRIHFRAGYDATINQFYSIDEGTPNPAGALVLSGAFRIHLSARVDRSTSRLPALRVDGIDPIPDRHFNGADKSACLCSPLEEHEFLQPEPQLRVFLKQLVIPFLYGQTFFSLYRRWPWAEYAHGATGILEAYAKVRGQNQAQECLRLLSQDSQWPAIRSALRQDPYMKGHSPCFCSSGDKVRRCHSAALKGALQLQRDLNARGIVISEAVTRRAK
jgi:hypothetical protein